MDGTSTKACARCGDNFCRPSGFSKKQWESRSYCSRRCAASKAIMTGADIERAYLDGMSSPELADKAGVSAVQIRRTLRERGVEIRSSREAMKISHSRPELRSRFSEISTGRRHSEETKRLLGDVRGSQHHLWKGGLTISPGGYLGFTVSDGNGEHAGKYLHRVIAAWKMGRELTSDEHVHHVDGNKLNNHPDNLEVMSASEHARIHAVQNQFGVRKNA